MIRRISVTFLITLMGFTGVFAQAIDTTWAGTLNYMGSTLDLFFTLSSTENGYEGTISVPDQGLRGLRLDTVKFEAPSLTLVHNKLGMKYSGIYVMGGFLGEFSQNGIEMPLNLLLGSIPVPKRPQEPKRPFPYREEEVVFHNSTADIDLAGTLTLPNGNGPFTTVVMVSGSGSQDRDEAVFDHKPFLVIADYLTRNGIAVLRYDDRGVGASGGTPIGCTTADFATDAQAAIDFLRNRTDVSKVGVCGHSEGGMIAFILGAQSRDNVDFIVSLAGSAVRGDKMLLSQQQALGKAEGFPDEYLSRIETINSGLYEIILASDKPDTTLRNDIIKYISNTPGATSVADSEIAVADQMMEPWMYYCLRYDPSSDIAKVLVPILALNGTNDLQVVATLNLPNILKNADIAGNENVTVKYLNGLNHLFQHSKTGSVSEYPKIEETFSEEALQMIVNWIKGLE